ncbi:MAG TPA: type II secretion system F family protein [bacterium]|nr:type II secretion system F family protein [bacterium]
MAQFKYEALGEDGKRFLGSLKAETKSDALDQIHAKSLRPLSIKEDTGDASGRYTAKVSRGTVGVSYGNVEVFLRQIANLLNSGIPLNRAIEIILKEVSHPATRKQWNAIKNDVVGGESLASAFSRWPGSFPPVYVAMVRAGETGGFLSVVLEQIADFRVREQDLKGRVKAALVYPLLLVVMAVLVLTFLMIYFIPQFSSIFEEFGGSLPALTRFIMSVSRSLLRYGVFIAMAVIFIVVGIKRALSSTSGKKAVEKVFLRIPLLGAVMLKFGIVRFCRMLGTLLESGVSLVMSLNVAREAIGNQSLSDAVSVAVDKVKNGISLARGLAASTALFPPSAIEMIAVAEESSRLDKELLRLASTYEGELDRQLRMLVSVIEPVLLFVMAGLVGTVVIGMLLPVFTLQELIR